MNEAHVSAFTVESTAAALRRFPGAPARWLVGGGGRLNPNLMRRLAERLQVKVEAVEAIGFDGDSIEAQCFAYCALRSRRGLPISFATTTGAPSNDVTACQNAVNPCSVGGEECKFLSCVDASESALVDNRITVIR